ncbi:glycosyltransferase family 2 protein [Sphingomonas sp.]|uniref:glycosyltransferase family 2 protein n=1 Tax=Sphingomonas sp. TaxID=28214 RepID=UPI0035C7F3CD
MTFDPSEQFDRDTIELFRSSLDPLEWAGFRERSWRMREFLALACTDGRAPYARLLDWCRSVDGAAPFNPHDTVSGDALVRTARLVSNQALGGEDEAAALALYDRAAALCPARFRDVDVTRYILLLGTAGRVAEARAMLAAPPGALLSPLEQALLRCNLRYWPRTLSAEQRYDATHRLHPLNLMLTRAGLATLGFDQQGSCFERLHTPTPPPDIVEGPRVSVVMTVFNPPLPIRHAVEGVLRQSWRNLRLVIVDDHSDPPHAAEIAACAALDPRVSVVRLPVNGGTYRARNIGMARCDGALVTFHDADDWSHPQKIERQVTHLLDGGHLACTSDWVRASPEMEFRLFSGSGRLSYENLSSFMIRREAAPEMLGGFDEVRSGADTEARHRLEVVSGRPIGRVEGPPLSVGLLHASSLTSESIAPGWFSPQRIQYRGGWRRWHEAIQTQGADPRLPQTPRPFAIPVALRPDRDTASVAAMPERIILGDFRYETPGLRAALSQARRWIADGHAVGLCQMGVVQKGRIQREWLADPAQAMISAGAVARMGFDDALQVALLLVADPAPFDLPAGAASRIYADALIVRADGWSLGPASGRAARIRRQILHLEQAFARPVRWLPAGTLTGEALAALVGPGALVGPEEAARLGLGAAGDESG